MATGLLEGHLPGPSGHSYTAVENESVGCFTDFDCGSRRRSPGFSRKARLLDLGYFAAVEPQDDNEPDDATCKSCGRKLTLVASLPKVGSRPRRRLYKCAACQMVITIPPTDQSLFGSD